ncbi:hypothetical protein [Reyranella sp.]|uniref:hypothetical protein n=1 Tax=Reyranella sp. TaxID=1929291 RepID=UPI003BA8F84C
MVSDGVDRAAEVAMAMLGFEPLNRAYIGVANAMNDALGKELETTRSLFAEFKRENGNSFAFGTFANFLFKKNKVYQDPDNEKKGYPKNEANWLRDAFQFSERDAKQMVAWVNRRLAEGYDHPLKFYVLAHDGETTALFLKGNEGDTIFIFCPKPA